MSILQLYRRTRISTGDLRRLVLFGMVGASGMVVDLGMLHLLHAALGFPMARAAAIGTAMVWNFGGNRLVTFRDSPEASLLRQFWKFTVSCSLGATVNWSISLLLAEKVAFFRGQILLCALAGVAAGYLLNFQLCRRWVFGGTALQQDR